MFNPKLDRKITTSELENNNGKPFNIENKNGRCAFTVFSKYSCLAERR